MHEHLIKTAVSHGSNALGRFVRLWLWSLATVTGVIMAYATHVDMQNIYWHFNPALLLVASGGLAFILALPVAVVVAIFVIAVKL